MSMFAVASSIKISGVRLSTALAMQISYFSPALRLPLFIGESSRYPARAVRQQSFIT